MIYKPSKNRMKDNCMFYHDGTYYLYSMYIKDGSELFNNVWCATSKDGVHFEDYGAVVEDFPKQIWAMKVYEGDDGFYMNSGSFTEDGKQAVLKFWHSYDLINWTYKSELDVISPEADKKGIRLDCMCVVENGGKYYGYATGQYGYLTSSDGAHWTPNPINISYKPFPEYNNALGGFEIADFIYIDGMYYLLCGGFGHLGMRGYGVYLYQSENPKGPFSPCLPFYRINGTSNRWVNMWERCFKKDGELLAHNYMYDGYTYECGNVYLPPIKKLEKEGNRLYLKWWENNNLLKGELLSKTDCLSSQIGEIDIFDEEHNDCDISSGIFLPNSAFIEAKLTLETNKFTKYSYGGIYLGEDKTQGTAILFDTFGKCDIAYIKNGKIEKIEDTIGFGSCSIYHLADGETYDIRIITKDGMFEVYVNNIYLQTFNSAHFKEDISRPFKFISSISVRKGCTLTNVEVSNLNL